MMVCYMELVGCLIKNIIGRKMFCLCRVFIYYLIVIDFVRLCGWLMLVFLISVM